MNHCCIYDFTRGCKNFIKDIVPLILPIDWQFQYLFIKHNLKVGWSYPPAFIHGSKEGIFKTDILQKINK